MAKIVIANAPIQMINLLISERSLDEYKKYNLTSFCAVDRFFRERELRNEGITEE